MLVLHLVHEKIDIWVAIQFSVGSTWREHVSQFGNYSFDEKQTIKHETRNN